MHIIYAQEPIPTSLFTKRPSLFLAGPTPRSPKVASWRPEALDILRANAFDGFVLVPEFEHEIFGGKKFDHDKQISWERWGLACARCILFWIPRNLRTLPGLTTNAEFAFWVRSGKIVLGAPHNAPKMRWLHHYANLYNVPRATTLPDTLDLALRFLAQKSASSKRFFISRGPGYLQFAVERNGRKEK